MLLFLFLPCKHPLIPSLYHLSTYSHVYSNNIASSEFFGIEVSLSFETVSGKLLAETMKD